MAGGGVEVASAYVTLMPSMRGFQGRLDKQLRGITSSAGARAGDRFGSGFSAAASKWAKRSAIAIGGAVTTALGAALWKGWERVTAIENAESKLRGLGHSAKAVESIMKSALDSVKGTAYGLGDAATIAAGAVAAGVKPGKELTRYLKMTADAATIAGVSINEMGPIMNRVQTQQRAYTMELNMLADRGIPIYQWLAEEYGVTALALRDMVADGKVDAETYFKVIEKNIGGAALESGKTTTGALMNIGAALSRFGAQVLQVVFPLLQPFFTKVIEWIDYLTAAVEPWAEEMSAGITAFGEAWKAFDGDVTSSGFPGFMERLAFILRSVFEEGRAAFTAFASAWRYNDGEITSSGIPGVMERLGYWARQTFDYVRDTAIPALARFGGFLWENRGFLLTVAGAFAAVYTAVATYNKIVLVAQAVTRGLAAIWAVITSPVWLTAAAIAAVAGALYLAYQNSETFRNFVSAAWEQVQSTVGDAWENTIRPALESFRDWIVNEVVPAVTDFWQNTAVPAFKAIGEWIARVWENLIWPALQAFAAFIMEDVIPAVLWLWEKVIQPVFTRVAGIIAKVWTEIIWPALQAFANFVADNLGPILLWLWENVVRPVIRFIGEVIKKAWENVIWPALNAFFDFIENVLIPAWTGARDTADTVFSAIGGFIKGAWDNVIKPTFDFFTSGVEALADTFDTTVKAIGKAWEFLKMVVAKPIVAVLEFVNDGIIGGINKILDWIPGDQSPIPTIPIPQKLKWAADGVYLRETKASGGKTVVAKAGGGVLPGWSPGKDDYYFRGDKFDLALSGGEAIMRPEWTKAVGRDFIDGANAAARKGGVQGVRDYLGGGQRGRDRRGGGLLDWVADAASGAAAFFRGLFDDPIKAIADILMGPIDMLRGNFLFDFAVAATKKVAEGAKDWFLSLIGWDSGSAAAAGPNHGGMKWPQIWALISSVVPGAVMTSNFRKNAITRSGFRSYHGLGRAVDFVAPNMLEAFYLIRGLLPWTELYFSPAGNNQMRNGRPYNTYGTPAWADHFDHIHAAFAKGGIFAGLYDNGGYLPPGLSLVANATGKPEPVLTDEQWRAVAEGGGRGDTFILQGVPMDHAGRVAGEILYQQKRTARGKYRRRR